MSEYLDGLGAQASVGDVFEDVYGQVDALIATLNARRAATGKHSIFVPGTELRISWGSGAEMHGRERGIGQYVTRGLSVELDDTTYSLVGTQTFRANPTAPDTPMHVAGHRGYEIGGDYSLTLVGADRVEVKLGKLGLNGAGRVENDEPVGRASLAAVQRVSSLPVIERQRLSLVTDGIRNNIAAAELIAAGQAVKDVFDAMEKPTRTRSYWAS